MENRFAYTTISTAIKGMEEKLDALKSDDVTGIYFIKDEVGNRIPFMFSETSRSLLLEEITDTDWVQKIQKDFPFSKGNLFVMVDGVEFKIDHNGLDIHPITD